MQRTGRTTPDLTRRAMLAAIAACLGTTACTPLRMLFGAYPEEFRRDKARVDAILHAFVSTVVPGVNVGDPVLIEPFYDRFYPMARFRGFFAASLCQGAQDLFGGDRFELLDPAERTVVIQHGLDAGGTTKRLFSGAIYLVQVCTYAGVYDDRNGCPLIDYPGQFRGGAISYPDPEHFLAMPRSLDGHPA